MRRTISPFVLWLELFSSSKHMASNCRGCIYGVRRRETTPSLAAQWLGRKKAKVFWHQSETRTTPTVWNWSVKTLSPGALLRLFDFSWPEFFSRPFRLFPGLNNCPWLSEDTYIRTYKLNWCSLSGFSAQCNYDYKFKFKLIKIISAIIL